MTTIKFKRLNIEAYKPGKSSIRRLKKIIKLSANESALGVSTRVKKIISNKNLNLFRYPDGKSKELRNQISIKFRCNKEKIICIFQPHRISRLKDLKKDFTLCFKKADQVILCPIFSAGEKIRLGFNYYSLSLIHISEPTRQQQIS